MDAIVLGDCMEEVDSIPDRSIDLIMMDPPYELDTHGSGCFGSNQRKYFSELKPISRGISNEFLDKLATKQKNINMYIWCNKTQIPQYLKFCENNRCTYEIICWHKTNPVPACHNKYLSDTEYIIWIRGKGVQLYGSYETKHKFYVTPVNHADKEKYHHPTVKPLEIVQNLISNSINPENPRDFICMDPFMGTGTTAVACINLGVHYIGFEIDPAFHQTAVDRCVQATLERDSQPSIGLDRSIESWGGADDVA